MSNDASVNITVEAAGPSINVQEEVLEITVSADGNLVVVETPNGGTVEIHEESLALEVHEEEIEVLTVGEIGPRGPVGAPGPVGAIVWSDVLQGAVDGENHLFVLSMTPSDSASVVVYKNGLKQRAGSEADYLITGSIIAFNPWAIPLPGDWLSATYPFAG
jgi:hypothetical protein